MSERTSKRARERSSTMRVDSIVIFLSLLWRKGDVVRSADCAGSDVKTQKRRWRKWRTCGVGRMEDETGSAVETLERGNGIRSDGKLKLSWAKRIAYEAEKATKPSYNLQQKGNEDSEDKCRNGSKDLVLQSYIKSVVFRSDRRGR